MEDNKGQVKIEAGASTSKELVVFTASNSAASTSTALVLYDPQVSKKSLRSPLRRKRAQSSPLQKRPRLNSKMPTVPSPSRRRATSHRATSQIIKGSGALLAGAVAAAAAAAAADTPPTTASINASAQPATTSSTRSQHQPIVISDSENDDIDEDEDGKESFQLQPRRLFDARPATPLFRRRSNTPTSRVDTNMASPSPQGRSFEFMEDADDEEAGGHSQQQQERPESAGSNSNSSSSGFLTTSTRPGTRLSSIEREMQQDLTLHLEVRIEDAAGNDFLASGRRQIPIQLPFFAGEDGPPRPFRPRDLGMKNAWKEFYIQGRLRDAESAILRLARAENARYKRQ